MFTRFVFALTSGSIAVVDFSESGYAFAFEATSFYDICLFTLGVYPPESSFLRIFLIHLISVQDCYW